MTGPYRILLAKRVATDLERIFDYIAERSPQNAPRLIDRILSSVEGLADLPHRTIVAGQSPDSPSPVRSLPVPPYIVFFRVDDAQRTVRILRVRHGARKPLKRYE